MEQLFRVETFEELETITVAFLSHFKKKIAWEFITKYFEDYKKHYYGKGHTIITDTLDPTRFNKLNKESFSYVACAMISELHHRQNIKRFSYGDAGYSRNIQRIYSAFYRSYKKKAKFDSPETEKQIILRQTTEKIIKDINYNIEYTDRMPSAQLKKTASLHLYYEDFDVLYEIGDMLEEEGFDNEADHFRQDVIHTWCCPVMRKIAGI